MGEVKNTEEFRSLSSTLITTFVAISAMALLTAGGLFLYFDFITQQKLISEHQRAVAYKASQTVDAFLQEEFSILEKSVVLSDLADVSQGDQKKVLEKLIGKVPSFRQLVLLDSGGEQKVWVSRLSTLLSEELIIYDKSEILPKVSQGDAYMSPVYVDVTTNEPMVILAVGVADILGNFRGVLLAEVNLKFMWELVGEIEVGEGGSAYVVDKRGNLLAFDNIGRVLKGENLSNLDEVKRFIQEAETEHDEDAVSISRGIQNTMVIASHVHLQSADWAIVVELPVLEAYRSVISRAVISMVTVIGILVLVFFVAVYLARRITRPIVNLRAAADKIGQGHLDTEIQVQTHDEVGELASAFDQMTKKLRQYSQDLEKRVVERTQELNIKLQEIEKMNKLMVGRELKMTELKKEIAGLKKELKSQKV